MNIVYKICNVLANIIAIGFFGLVALIFFLLYLSDIEYDTHHPNYSELESLFSDLDSNGFKIDFTFVNNGNWKELCVLGGYSNPSTYMANKGNFSKELLVETEAKAVFPFRLGEIEEFEVAIALVDLDNRIRIIHLAHAHSSGFQHFKKCTYRNSPIMDMRTS